MATVHFVSDLEVSQAADELVIRGRRKHVIVAVVLACLLVPFSLAIAWQNTVGTAGVPALWDRSPDDQIFGYVAVLITLLAFGVLPIVACVVLTRKRRRPWVFDRSRGQLTRSDQSWPLAEMTAVTVDVRRGKGFLRGATPESAGVLLQLNALRSVEITRFHASRGKAAVPIEHCVRDATDLANVVGDFLRVPVQLPASIPRF
jgi:hypothetical protein